MNVKSILKLGPTSAFSFFYIFCIGIHFGFCTDITYDRSVYTYQAVGEIRGRVTDAETGEPMIAATVGILNSSEGTITNTNGEFHLEKLETGVYELVFSFVGYTPKTRTVALEGGTIANVSVTLSPSSQTLDDVVIQGTIDKSYTPINNSTEISVISSMQSSMGIYTGISREQIEKSIDFDGGDVVKRVSGVSLLNRFVVVRGMDPRYNMTLLNGIVAPSSEESTRAFSYDALPTGVIDKIGLSKTPAPELPAMWGGGVLEVTTRNTSVARQLEISFSGQYRTEGSSFTDNFLTYKASDRDWLAAGAKDRQLPTLLRLPYFVYPNYEQYPLENIAVARSGNFRAFTPQASDHNFDKRGRISYYDSWKIGNVRINNLTAANYTQERLFRVTDVLSAGGFYIPTDSINDEIVYVLDSTRIGERTVDSLYQEQIRFSAIQSLGVVINQNHNVDATIFYNRLGNDQLINTSGFNQELGEGGPSQTNLVTYSYRYSQREIGAGQINGRHQIGKHQLKWTAGGAFVRENVPDFQLYSFSRNFVDGSFSPIIRRLEDDSELYVNVFSNSHYVFETDEQSLTARIDYTHQLPFVEDMYLRAGIFWDRKDRDFYSQNHRIVDTNIAVNNVEFSSDSPWENMDQILTPDNFALNRLGLKSALDQGKYSFDDETRAAYLAVNLPLLNQKLNLYGGVRFARFNRTLYNEFNAPVNEDSVLIGSNEYASVPPAVNEYWLPSISVRYTFNDSSQIRLVYGQTIDRPQFREQAANLRYIDFISRQARVGNPTLTNALIHHADLRFDIYPSAGEVITFGAFYKYLNSPVLTLEDIAGGNSTFNTIRFDNGNYAEVYGAEVEIRRRLDFLPIPILRSVSAIINASIIESNAVFSSGEESRLQGASPYLVNAGIYYDNIQTGTNLSLIYNLTGDRLQVYSLGQERRVGALVEARRHQLDITFSQEVTNFLKIKGGVQDVLNNPFRFYRDGNDNFRYDPGSGSAVPSRGNEEVLVGDYSERVFTPGRYFSLGFTLTIR